MNSLRVSSTIRPSLTGNATPPCGSCGTHNHLGRRHHEKKRKTYSLRHPLAKTITSSLVGFDEYPVDNFHSVLRSRTRETDSAERVNLMAREIDARKHDLHNFQLTFVPKEKHNFSHKNVKILQVKGKVPMVPS